MFLVSVKVNHNTRFILSEDVNVHGEATEDEAIPNRALHCD